MCCLLSIVYCCGYACSHKKPIQSKQALQSLG